MAQKMQSLVTRIELGRRLHDLRWVRGLSLRDLEDLTKIPMATLGRWERARGTHYPDVERIAILSSTFDVAVSDLLDADFDTRVWFNGRT